MTDFKKLRTLDVGAAMLLGVEAVGGERYYSTQQCLTFVNDLPQSLEHLRLYDSRRPLIIPIRQLLLSPTLPPRLKTLKVSVDILLLFVQFVSSDSILKHNFRWKDAILKMAHGQLTTQCGRTALLPRGKRE